MGTRGHSSVNSESALKEDGLTTKTNGKPHGSETASLESQHLPWSSWFHINRKFEAPNILIQPCLKLLVRLYVKRLNSMKLDACGQKIIVDTTFCLKNGEVENFT